MFRGLRPPRWYITRDIQILVRSFPSGKVTITRPSAEPSDSNDFGEPIYEIETVYAGEALFIPAGGSVTRYGLGQVEEDQPQMLIAGRPDIRQGDYVSHVQPLGGGRTAPPRLYQVGYAPNHWYGFVAIVLKIFEQGVR